MDLKTKAIKSTVWYIGTRVWMQALSWVVTMVLARILAPEDYGLFAMAFTVIVFFELFQEFGLGVSIIQRQDLTREQINAIFWIIFGISLGLVSVAFATANIAAVFYREPRLTWIIRLLSLTFLFGSLGMVPYSLLTKEIDFKRRSLAQAYSVVTSAAISLGIAYLGYGVWALVVGYLFRAFVGNLMMLVWCGWLPGLKISLLDMREIIKFGLKIAGAGGILTIAGLANNAIIGRFLGGYDLGIYSVANSLGTNSPVHKISTGVINQLSLPVFSKLQQNDVELRSYFLTISKYIAVISFPMQIGMALVAVNFVSVVLSDKWLPTVMLIQIFALGGIFDLLPLPSAPLLTARGKANEVFKFSCMTAGAITASCVMGAQFGLYTVAVLWLATFPLVKLYFLLHSLKEIGLSVRAYGSNIFAPIVASSVMAAVLLVIQHNVPVAVSPLIHLILEVIVGAFVYIAVLLMVDKRFGAEVKVFASELFATSRV